MSATDEQMWDLVQARELPLLLTRLSDFTIQAATKAAFDQIDITPEKVLGARIFDLMDVDERPRAREALQALADGTIDFYRTYRPLSHDRTRQPGVYVWSHAIDFGPRRFALSEIRATRERTESPLVESLGYEPAVFAIGVMDQSGIVTSVSNDVDEVIGIGPDALVGHALLPHEQYELWARFHPGRPHAGCSMSMPYPPHSGLPSGVRIQCLLMCLAGSKSFCFILSRAPALPSRVGTDRVAELEEHLRRIAHEVQASGIIAGMGRIPDPARFPQLRSLNARQWDVMNRLLGGERVPTIAAEMYLSQSAVRNHLSELFQKFGVHSQSELLALLRS
jgi:DNA-binding CsgD family transcriptional regulator